MIRFKVDILQELKAAGYNTGRLRKEKIIGEKTIQDMRHDKVVSWKVMNMLCGILRCQPGDLVEYIEDPQEKPLEEPKKNQKENEVPAADQPAEDQPEAVEDQPEAVEDQTEAAAEMDAEAAEKPQKAIKRRQPMRIS